MHQLWLLENSDTRLLLVPVLKLTLACADVFLRHMFIRLNVRSASAKLFSQVVGLKGAWIMAEPIFLANHKL